MIGLADGDTCGRKGCDGIIGEHPPDNCSCHISPPCGACTAPRFFCPTCGREEASACGYSVRKGQADCEIRVATGGAWTSYRIDRWD